MKIKSRVISSQTKFKKISKLGRTGYNEFKKQGKNQVRQQKTVTRSIRQRNNCPRTLARDLENKAFAQDTRGQSQSPI